MTEDQLNHLRNLKVEEPFLHVNDLHCKLNKTLLYGYTCIRDTFHVYLMDGALHKIIYNFYGDSGIVLSYSTAEAMRMEDLMPDKRLYPETCDFHTCSLLTRESGVRNPTFTTYNSQRPKPASGYYGKIREDFPF